MAGELPPLLRFLSGELGYQVQEGETTRGYGLFYLDLAQWKLRLSHRTPVVWVRKADVESASPKHLVESLQDVVRERNFGSHPLLVLLDGDGRPVREHVSRLLHNLVVIGSEDQERILLSRRPTGELQDLVAAQIPLCNLSPYESSAPVQGSRFFGREYEVRKILGNLDTNYAVLGIRRIGKTSLLHEIKRRLEEEPGAPHVVYMDCSVLTLPDEYIREVVRQLEPRELQRLHLQEYSFFFPHFLERMRRKYRSKIIFLLDEIDNLILMQRGDWGLFEMLRASSNEGCCQYIIAGFREALREQYFLESPLFNFAQPIRLNEFTKEETRDLIVTPMENLRVHFRNKDEVVSRIYDETAGQPNLIQYYCTILLQRLDITGTREISADSLIDVYKDEGFKGHLLTTFMINTNNREKAVVYALLAHYGERRPGAFTQGMIDAMLKKHCDATLSQAEIDAACRNLVLAGVFRPRGKDYFFASPVFPRMLQQTHDLAYLLKKVKEEGL